VPDLLDSVILGTEPQAASDLLDSVDLGTDVYGENHLQLPDAIAHPDTVSETVIENRGRDILGLTCPTSLATIGNSLSGLQQNLTNNGFNEFHLYQNLKDSIKSLKSKL
jgi:hypothetical protein